MKSHGKKMFAGKVVLSAVGLAAALSATPAWASDIAQVEGLTTAAGNVTIDSNAVITAILSQPGTVGVSPNPTHTYTGWSFLVQDGTGSMDVYASQSVLTSLGYTPTVGDTITLTTTISPFHQIPETGTVSAISLVSSNSGYTATPLVVTIPQANVATLPYSSAGYLVQFNDVTISGLAGSTFGLTNSPARRRIRSSRMPTAIR